MKHLTTKEAAVRLGVTPQRVRALVTKGRLPAETHGRDLLIKENDLALVADRKRGRPSKREAESYEVYIKEICNEAKHKELIGEYESARDVLLEVWPIVGERPRVEGLSEKNSAELLLRAGALTGHLGSVHQIKQAQALARKLIAESIEIFKSLKDTNGAAEALIELGICCWRVGQFNKAREHFQEALSLIGDASPELQVRAFINWSVAECQASRYEESRNLMERASLRIDSISNNQLKGLFHHQYGYLHGKMAEVSTKESYRDRAIIEYTAASYHYEKAGHKRYCARMENNIGFLLLLAGKLEMAEKHLARAHTFFAKLKDVQSLAQVDDTRARAFMAQGDFTKAEKVARDAVRALEDGDEKALLADVLITLGTIQARRGHYTAAQKTLQRAIDLASEVGDFAGAGRAALVMAEELGQTSKAK
jgi:excisionase family DNA binding protein